MYDECNHANQFDVQQPFPESLSLAYLLTHAIQFDMSTNRSTLVYKSPQELHKLVASTRPLLSIPAISQ